MASEDPIQRLLKAEEKAAEIVSSARDERVKRLKAATADAEKSVAQLKDELEQKFKSEIAQSASADEKFVSGLKAEIDKEFQAIEAGFVTNREEVTNLLLKSVTTVALDVPEALKQAYLGRKDIEQRK